MMMMMMMMMSGDLEKEIQSSAPLGNSKNLKDKKKLCRRKLQKEKKKEDE